MHIFYQFMHASNGNGNDVMSINNSRKRHFSFNNMAVKSQSQEHIDGSCKTAVSPVCQQWRYYSKSKKTLFKVGQSETI